MAAAAARHVIVDAVNGGDAAPPPAGRVTAWACAL